MVTRTGSASPGPRAETHPGNLAALGKATLAPQALRRPPGLRPPPPCPRACPRAQHARHTGPRPTEHILTCMAHTEHGRTAHGTRVHGTHSIHAHTCTYTPHTCAHTTQVHTYMAHTHMCTHGTRACTAHTHTYPCAAHTAHVYTSVHVCKHTVTHACAHTHTHTHGGLRPLHSQSALAVIDRALCSISATSCPSASTHCVVKTATPCPALRAAEGQGVQGRRRAIREGDSEAASHGQVAGSGRRDNDAWAAWGPLPLDTPRAGPEPRGNAGGNVQNGAAVWQGLQRAAGADRHAGDRLGLSGDPLLPGGSRSGAEASGWSPRSGAGGSARFPGSPESPSHQSGAPSRAAHLGRGHGGSWGVRSRPCRQAPPSPLRFPPVLQAKVGFCLFCFKNLNNWHRLHQPMGSGPRVTLSTRLGCWPS